MVETASRRRIGVGQTCHPTGCGYGPGQRRPRGTSQRVLVFQSAAQASCAPKRNHGTASAPMDGGDHGRRQNNNGRPTGLWSWRFRSRNNCQLCCQTGDSTGGVADRDKIIPALGRLDRIQFKGRCSLIPDLCFIKIPLISHGRGS